ncbi:MAG: PDDEXK nuclease domain-containing protein [Thermoguttaceae bacterium]
MKKKIVSKTTTERIVSGEHSFFEEMRTIVKAARGYAYSAVNTAMVEAYWLLGKRIVEQEQQGQRRAEYGENLMKNLSVYLTKECGKGFSLSNVKDFRLFYLFFQKGQTPSGLSGEMAVPRIGHTACAQTGETDFPAAPAEKSYAVCSLSGESRDATGFSQKSHALRGFSGCDENIPFLGQLSWSHYRQIMRVSDPAARYWYLKEAAENRWSVRTLDRNIATQYYERLLISQVREPVVAEMDAKTAAFQTDKLEFIKNPAVLEFLGLQPNLGYTEAALESAISDNLQRFLLELGKGYAFVERQKLVRTETRDYYVDLVFYNFILKCFVLIDLKTSRITHQDVGQMDMYVRMYDETLRGEGDNPTIGIVLCSETDQDIARYSILKENEQIFATKYKLYLPSEEELRNEIERQKTILRLQTY